MDSKRFSYLIEEDRLQAIELARHIARREWVLFAGSGISRSRGLPLWDDLVKEMVKRLGPEVESVDPLEVASLFEANFGRPALIKFLRDHLQVSDLHSNSLHECLLDLNPSKIVTTNFDDLFERALEQRKIPYASAATNGELSLIGDRLLVLKPHGDFKHPDSLVFSRRDYARYPQHKAINATLFSWVARYSFLFVGYSLSDPDLEYQLQSILDAQGDLARTHYILIDSIGHQRRNALLRLRNIQVIKLGSYDNLENFLTDLSNEAETIHSREIKSQPLYAARSLESSELSVAEQQLLEVLSEDYTPVVQALEQSHFVDAEAHLQRVLKKIDNFGANPGLGQKLEFKSFHQRVLLASAAVAAGRQKREEARDLFQRAEELQPFAEKRRLQAAEVLIHLGDFQKVESLLLGSAEAHETRGKEILGLVALLRNDEDRFHELYPSGDENNLEFVIQQARLAMESSQDDTAKSALDLLDKAWEFSEDFPQGLFLVAGMTDNMLRRIVIEEWEAPGVNREELLKTIRDRYQEVLSIFEGLVDQYPEGLVLILSSLLSFHRTLHEHETQQSIFRRLQPLPHRLRERVLAEHLAGEPSPALEVIESLSQSNLIGSDEKVLLKGDALKRDGKKREAEQIYRQALLEGEKSEVQQALILALLELLLEQERYAEAFTFLDKSLEDGPFRALMKGMILSHRNDQEGALATIRLALTEHPRNMLLRKSCVRLLRQKGALTESLEQAERLEELLPSFEHKLLRAEVLKQLDQNEESLQIVREIEGEGYITLPLVDLKCSLLQRLGQHREAAGFLESHQDHYSDNSTLYYSLRFNEATAWASAGEIDKAVAIWEDLREHSESGSDLYRNLYIAYVQREAYDPGAFSKAFNIAKEALERFPYCHEFAPYLIESGLGSGRSEEAWEIIGRRPELQQSTHLRAIPSEEAIEVLSQQTQVLRATEDFYRAGGIPFFAYADCSPRTPLFLWVARIVLWRKGSRETPLLCGFSRPDFGTKRLQLPSGGIILDQTALLTLGILGVTGEILEAISRAGKSALLFPGARTWIEQEIAQLSVNQLPAYREQYRCLQRRLLAERGRVEIVEEVNNQKNTLDETMCQKLGLSAWDVGLAVISGAYYVDDYLSSEEQESIPPECVISSSDFFGALEEAGVLFPEEVSQIRKTRPAPFAKPGTGVLVTLDKPFVFSLSTLLSWFEAGLLERWLTDNLGWPTRIIVGPIAWLQLGKEIAEENIYREALQIATNLKAAITEAFKSDVAEELPSTDPPDIGVQAPLHNFLQQSLILLSHARDRQAALWADDLCSRLLTDARGPLLQDQQIIDTTRRIRNAFSEVSVIGTEDVLSWLEDSSQLSKDRRLTLVRHLHQDGYRFLDVGDILLWLLERFDYNLDAVHVDELLRDLKRAPEFTLPGVNSERLSFLISHTLSQVLSKTIWNLWTLESPQLSQNQKREISNELVGVFENAAENSQLEPLFWTYLIFQVWKNGKRDERLKEFLEWIGEFISTNIETHRRVLRYVEEFTLNVLPVFNSDDEKEKTSAQHLLSKLLVPFFSQKLLKEFDPVFRRLIGVALGIDVEFTQTFQSTGPQGKHFEITVKQEVIEKQACSILTRFLSGERPTELSFLHPFYIGIQLERTIDGSIVEAPDGQPFRVGGQEEISLLFLPLVANSSTRRKLFDHFFALLEEVDPPLAVTIRELEDALTSDDPAISTKALQDFYYSYLLSTHFQLMRDLVRGFEYLSTLPLEKFDALIGPLPLWSEEERFQEVIEKFASEKQKGHENPPLQKISQQLLFLCEPSELIFSSIRSRKPLSDLYPNKHQFDDLSQTAQAIETDFDVFHSLARLGILLYEAYHSTELKVSVDGKEKLLREWLTDHLLGVLGHEPPKPALAVSAEQRFFPDRQTIHVRSLRYAFRAAAHPTHGRAIIQERYGEKGRSIAGELLMRGVLLARRILIVSVHHSPRSLEDTTRQLETTITQFSSPWSGPLLQDQFNPELYGPGRDQYDHVLAGTLAVFWNLGFDETMDKGGSKTFSSSPFWLTQPVRRALRDLAKRPENNAEQQVREDREKGIPNRLQTFLNQTPQEYAAEILRFTFPKYSNEEDLLLRGREVLLDLLQQATDSDNIEVDIAPQQGGLRPDTIVTIKNGEKERQILVEAKMSAEPRYLRHAIIQLQQFLEKLSIPYGVILAPSISERGRKICEGNNVGYVDLAGNAHVKFDGIYIKTAAQRAAKRRRGRTKTLFAPVSTRLIRALLVEPKRAWKLKELAETVHMSIGQAHKVKQELFNHEFIEFDLKKRLVLKDPSGLLNAWREVYRYENNEPRSLFSLDKISVLEKRVKQCCDTKKIGYALTLFTGADRYAPFVRHSMTAFYCAGNIEALQQELDLKPVDSGANIFLLTPYDEGVFYGLQEVEGYQVVSAVQLYLDLYGYGGRGREQAEFLREKLLAF